MLGTNTGGQKRIHSVAKKMSLLLGGVLLAMSIGVVLVGELSGPARSASGDALSGFALEVPGWELTYLPLGGTPEQSRVVEQTLQCDQALNLRYVRGDGRIDIYAAYWRPGKTPVHMVARHTPDICWVASGWQCLEKMRISSSRLPMSEGQAMVEYRTFRNLGRVEHVGFFHLIDGRVSSLAESDSGVGSAARWANALFRNDLLFWHIGRDDRRPSLPVPERVEFGSRRDLSAILNQRKEQMFVRVSSNRPLAEFWDSPVVTNFLRQLPLRRAVRDGVTRFRPL